MNLIIKKFFLYFMSILFLITLSSCLDSTYERLIHDYNFYEISYVHIGDIIEIDLEELAHTYDFDDIQYENYIDFRYDSAPKIVINRLNQPIAVEEGITSLDVILYKGSREIARIYLGQYIISKNDALTDDFIGLNNNNIVYYLSEFPNGKYYLSGNITMNVERYEERIPFSYFSGILINPYQYKISYLSQEDHFFTGLFKQLDKARIDGLIFDEVDYTLTTNNSNQLTVVGVLAGEAKDSLITNVSVEGSIKSTQLVKYVGGIVGYSENSIFRGVSFKGEMDCYAYSMGGIIGDSMVTNERMYYSMIDANIYPGAKPLHVIENGYVIADLTNHSGIEYIAPAVYTRVRDSTRISNFYFDGLLNDSNIIDHSYFYTNDQQIYFSLENHSNLYTTLRSPDELLEIPIYITLEKLISGDHLVYLNGFIYETGEYPVLERWVKP